MAIPKQDGVPYLLRNNVKIWRLVGVAACTVDGSSGVAQHNVFLYLLITTATLAMCISQGMKVYKMFAECDLQSNPFRIIAGLRSAVVAGGFAYHTTLHLLIFNKCMVNFFNCFNDMEHRFPQSLTYRKRQLTELCILLGTVITIGICDITLNVVPHQFDFLKILKTIVFTYPLMAPDARLMHFTFILKSLQFRAEYIFEELSSYTKNVGSNGTIAWLGSPVKRKVATADKIKYHRQHWAHIMQSQDHLNCIYGGYLLVLLTLSFLEAVFGVFLHITIWQFSISVDESIGYLRYWYLCFGMLMQLGRMLLVVETCNSWVNKAESLHLVLDEVLDHIQDEDTAREVQKFQSNLHVHKPRISAAGFFDIHYGYLYDLMGSVAMYIIILLQFKFDTTCLNPLQDLSKEE